MRVLQRSFAYLDLMRWIKPILLILFVLIAATAIYYWIKFSANNIEKHTMNDEARKNVSGQFIKLTDGITHYEAGGADSGKVVILVHGFSVPYYIWDATYDSLVRNGFYVVRYGEFGRR